MYSVTGRIGAIKQPKGGYLPASSFIAKQYDDGKNLNADENVHGSLVGLAVDYLTRYGLTKDLVDSFRISLMGANILGKSEYAVNLLKNVAAGDIASAVKLTAFDAVFRAGVMNISVPSPDAATVENIDIMVRRGINFLESKGSVVKAGFTFEGGYTDMISSGDGDYLTEDSLIDFKVLRGRITSQHTLQLLMYYLMGLHSIHREFKTVKYLSIFNPRKNIEYSFPTEKISDAVINEVSTKVIGY